MFSNGHANPDTKSNKALPRGLPIIENLIKDANEKMTSNNYIETIRNLLIIFKKSKFIKLFRIDSINNHVINYGKKLFDTKLQGDKKKFASEFFRRGVNNISNFTNYEKIIFNLDKCLKTMTDTNFKKKIKALIPNFKNYSLKLFQKEIFRKLIINHITKIIDKKIKDEENKKTAIDLLTA